MKERAYPPFTLDNTILNLATEITLLLGQYEGLALPVPKPELRKHNRIRTIQSSLAIEGNTLSVEQVTDIINHKRVIAPKKDILEVKNAVQAYNQLAQFDVLSLDSLLMAHKILMRGLLQNAGKLRTGNVGVKSGETIIHMAPPYAEVPNLMNHLFSFLKREEDLHPLVKSSVFHYELEFIHPFIDGNGRIGRLWQSAILYHYRSIFEYIPIESVIRNRQIEYYDALQVSNKQGQSTIFVRFMLETILQAVVDFTKQVRPENQTMVMRIQLAKDRFGETLFTRKEYMKLNQNISTATASRDLAFAVKKKTLKKTGDKAVAKYQFI